MKVRSFLKLASTNTSRKSQYNKLVSQYYDKVSNIYRYGWGDCFHFAPFHHNENLKDAIIAIEKKLIHDAGINSEMDVLDIGCGIGGPARNIARLSGCKITGITISKEQVKIAEKITKQQNLQNNCSFKLMDAMKMSFDDNSFDAVYSIECICHIPDKKKLYKEVHRILKPGGIFAGWDWIKTTDLSEKIEKKHIEKICIYFALPSMNSLNNINSDIKKAGFEIMKIEDLQFTGNQERPWTHPLTKQMMNPLSKLSGLISPTIKMMQESGKSLIYASEKGCFSPFGYFVAKK